MVILVCGTRDGEHGDGSLLYAELDELHESERISLVVQGYAASGGDKFGRVWADRNGVLHTGPYYKPDWGKYGRRAGFVRNEQMLDNENPDLVVARWDGNSKGTLHTITESIKRGISVRIVPCVGRERSPE